MLCQDCRRGMIYCGSCDEEAYFRFHEYKEAKCFDCDGKGWIVTTGVNNLPEQETCQVCNGEKTLMYSKEEFEIHFGIVRDTIKYLKNGYTIGADLGREGEC